MIIDTADISHRLLKKALVASNQVKRDSDLRYCLADLSDEEARKKILEFLDAGMIYDAFRVAPRQNPQRYIVAIQRDALAQTFDHYLAHFSDVQEIVFMGSQGINNFEDQVIPAVKMCREGNGHHPAIKMPKVRKMWRAHPGVLGAALAYAVEHEMIEPPYTQFEHH
jgi:hypothetical protein